MMNGPGTRSEDEILELILGYARSHDSIRAVVLQGSRVNPNARKDQLQDFDVVYLTTDVEAFTRQSSIPAYFGTIMIVQLPDDMGDPPPARDGGYAYLMQFTDGSRIDLGIRPVRDAAEVVADSLTTVLLDKDELLGGVPPSSEAGYLPARAGRKEFDDCCNEFWWLNPYVAKGIWRDELSYAKHMMETPLRTQLVKMIVWDVADRTASSVSPGKLGKNLSALMPPVEWRAFRGTYADWRPRSMWRALFSAGDLFRNVAGRVAQAGGFAYPEREDRLVSAYIGNIRRYRRGPGAVNRTGAGEPRP
jgi:aminoglycoside 6-adenylyltransferase